MAEEPEAPEAQEEGTPTDEGGGKGSSSSKIAFIFVGILVVVILVLGVIMFTNANKPVAIVQHSTWNAATPWNGLIYHLIPVRINLKDRESIIDVELSLSLELSEPAGLKEVESRAVQFLDTVIRLVGGKLSTHLNSPPKQNQLKRVILDEFNATLTSVRITNIYFRSFRLIHSDSLTDKTDNEEIMDDLTL